MKRIPIVVPLYGALEYTKRFVSSLERTTKPESYVVIFVDNASPDNTAEYLKELVSRAPDNFRVISSDKNLGFAGGVNLGLETVSEQDWDQIVVSNNDVVVTTGWLGRLQDCLLHANLNRVGVVAPVSNAAGGSQGIQIDYAVPTDTNIEKFAERRQVQFNQIWVETGLVVGLCFMMSRAFFKQVGYFDEQFGIGQWEDNDYFLKGQLLGFKYIIDQSTFIHHFFHKTFEESKIEDRSLFHKNRKLFCDKYTAPGGVYDQLALQNYKKRNQEPIFLESGHVKKYVVGALRVRDGAEFLVPTLDRVSQLADEIVVRVDIRSKGTSYEICKRYPKVTVLEIEEQEYTEPEGRNLLIQKAFLQYPDWVYNFDADEVPEERIINDLPRLTNPPKPDTHLWLFSIIQLWSQTHWRVDGLWGQFVQGRMFRVLPYQMINPNILHCGSHPQVPPENCCRSFGRIVHYGNANPEVRKRKYEYYTKTDTEGNLDLTLGAWKDYYWRQYYGVPSQGVAPVWRVVPDETPDPLPYGAFRKRDQYRHVVDDSSAKTIEFDEKNAIALCMLAKNEAQFLPKCILSVSPIVSEVIVVDTGSTDTTREVAESLGAKVYSFEWCDDFSAARNFALSKVTTPWLLRLDPDEVMPYQFVFGTYRMILEKDVDAYLFPIHNYMSYPRDLNDTNWVLSETTRLFKMHPHIQFRGRVHEEIDDSIREIGEERSKESGKDPKECIKVERAPFFIQHFGYLRESEYLDYKFNYYCQLGETQKSLTPEDPRPYFNVAVHYLHTGDFEKAIENYKKAVELDPTDWKSWNDIGVIYWKAGNLIEASKYIKHAKASMGNTIHPVHLQKIEQNLQLIRGALFEGVII